MFKLVNYINTHNTVFISIILFHETIFSEMFSKGGAARERRDRDRGRERETAREAEQF